jgi:glycosyltransferase involved in cell wall biosynthesis
MALPEIHHWAPGDGSEGHRIHVLPRPAVDLEIVVPAYNEERRIGPTLEKMRTFLREQSYSAAVVVVDNGSVDRTADAVAELQGTGEIPIHLINCARRGKGAAVRRGVLSSSADCVGFCDADLATPIETLDLAWPLLLQGSPIVIGSRKLRGAQYVECQPLLRRVGGWGFRMLAGRLVPTVSDTQCGFKLFRRPVAQQLFAVTREEGFAFDVEILALASALGVPISEVPVNWSDRPGSSFRPVQDGFGSVCALLAVGRRLRDEGARRGRPQSEEATA